MARFLLFLFVLLRFAAAAKLPTIGFMSKDVVADVGGDAAITCTVHDQQEYPVHWMRLGGSSPVSISRGSELLVDDDRFELSHDAASSTYTLSIRRVRESDATSYQCQVMISLDNVVAGTVDVKLKMPPAIKPGSVEPTKKVVAGNAAEMVCEATGYPAPTVTWSRLDGSLLPSGRPTFASSRFVIGKAKREDRGVYQCSANNGVGKGQNATVSLQVEFSPEIEVTRPRVPQALHYGAELSCEIEAFPPPSIVWKMGGVEVRNGDRFSVSHFAGVDDSIVSTLKLREVTDDLFGKYSCHATNRYGSAAKELELYRTDTPISPPLFGSNRLSASAGDVVTCCMAGILAVAVLIASFF